MHSVTTNTIKCNTQLHGNVRRRRYRANGHGINDDDYDDGNNTFYINIK